MKSKSNMTRLAFVAILALPTAAYGQDTVFGADVDPEAAAQQIAPRIDAPEIGPVAEPVVEPIFIIAPTLAIASAIEAASTGTESLLADAALSDQRGGQAIVIGNQTLNAVNSGSIINGNYTAGAVAITDNALSNFNGLGNVLINTGALNNLQSAMNVTINFAD